MVPVVKAHMHKNKVRASQINGLHCLQDGDAFATTGDDGTLRIWSTDKKTCTQIVNLNIDQNGMVLSADPITKELRSSAKLKSVDMNQVVQVAAIGCRDGTLRIVKLSGWQQINFIKQRKSKLTVVKFSPDGNWLAVGSHEGGLDIYSVPEFKILSKIKKNSEEITHIDWSTDSLYLQFCNKADEIAYVDVKKGQLVPQGALRFRDEPWADWTLPIGWPVLGAYVNASDYGTMSCAHRSHDDPTLIAVGDDKHCVKVLRYPCVNTLAKPIKLQGHSSKISSVRFDSKSRYLLTVGSDDLTILQWKILYGAN
jgi:WD40 repeat protein